MIMPTSVAVDMPAWLSAAGAEFSSFPDDVDVDGDVDVDVGLVRALVDVAAFAVSVVDASFDAGAVVSYPFSLQYRR